MNKLTKFIISIFIPLTVGFVGSFFTMNSISTWYIYLHKPFFTPPSWIFGPAWTALYIMMGISLYIIWINPIKNKKMAFITFGVQMFLNMIWSIIFFGFQSPLFAFIEIIILWISILLSIIYFFKISKSASYLLIPYILWVSFASILNFSIYYLNYLVIY